MKRVSVYYTKARVSGFSYEKDYPFLRDYRIEGDAERVELHLDYYSLVKTYFTRKSTVDGILHKAWQRFNLVEPRNITHMIGEEGLDTSHSSMSVGDIIKIDSRWFIVAPMDFDELVLNENGKFSHLD